MSDYTFFSKDPGHWGKSYQSIWGCHNICLLIQGFHIAQVTQSELTSLTCLKALGDAEKFCSDVAFLLVLPKEGAAEERVYRLTMVWVHLYQAKVSTIDGTAKQLTQLASTGPDWPYALHSMEKPATCPSLQRAIWVLWWRRIPAMSLMERSANWRFANSWGQAPGWFTQKDSMGVKFQW